jgi:hypothetical protein
MNQVTAEPALTWKTSLHSIVRGIASSVRTLFEMFGLVRTRRELALRDARRSAAALERTAQGSVAGLDPERLDATSFQKCPLGQVYGDWRKAPSHLREGEVMRGFIVFPRLRDYIDDAWRTVIAEARAAT